MEFTKLDKVYEATICLGSISTTGDPEGEISETHQEIPDISVIEQTAKSFVGKIRQTPPAFSAIKINGQRAYKLARQGKAVEIPSREVEIYSLDILSYEKPYLKIRTHVSSGTYIRALAEDLGKKLGCGAYVTELRRTQIANYKIDEVPLFDLPA